MTALPDPQPGPDGTLRPGEEAVRIAWQTEARQAEFSVRFGPDKAYGRAAGIRLAVRQGDEKHELDSRYNYVANLDKLELGTRYEYEVACNGSVIAEGYLTTRQPRGKRVRFAAFGDNSFGELSDKAIAFQAYESRPDFIMNTGDNVYESGLDNEYTRYFFPRLLHAQDRSGTENRSPASSLNSILLGDRKS